MIRSIKISDCDMLCKRMTVGRFIELASVGEGFLDDQTGAFAWATGLHGDRLIISHWNLSNELLDAFQSVLYMFAGEVYNQSGMDKLKFFPLKIVGHDGCLLRRG